MSQPNLGCIPLAKHTSAVKFLPCYTCKSMQLSLTQLETLCVGSTGPGCLLQFASSHPAPL